MVWLELIVIQEILEKVTNRESESTLKVSYENHLLIGLRCRHYFSGEQPA
jgi:hypothetical protein